uniref:Protein kinase domain-containing protein n=1 Tax=Rhizophagus irregularis (strain DAOM 181602 / DAOM 197198 / MUCL 43194) TaxID=747089 RepID=U9TJD9_RHIID
MICERCGKYLPFEWCKSCQINNLKNDFANWTSGNEKIDNLIQEMQLKIFNQYDYIIEWISYDQFNDIKELDKDECFTIYSAIWKDGPLEYDKNKYDYSRNQDTRINLKCLHNSQNITDEFQNEVKTCDGLYGLSQNSNTKDYILVLRNKYCNKCGECFINKLNLWCKSCQINDLEKNFINWTSGNEKIDNSIQEMQLERLEIDYYHDAIVEWIPYDQFNDIKELGKEEFATIYSAIWKDGPLKYDENKYEYIRQSTKVNLKLYNSHNITSEFLNKVKAHFENNHLYGISQNPDKDYIIILQDMYCDKCVSKCLDTYYKWCKPCQINNLKNNFTNWTSGNEKIDNLIQEMQLEIINTSDNTIEWITYNQFNYIKELGKDEFSTMYSAIWKDGPLKYDKKEHEYSRKQKTKVNLKLYNSQNITDEFLNEVKTYFNGKYLHGISQNTETKDYILVLEDVYCDKCNKKFTIEHYKWCKPCQINDLEKNWTSGNEKIDNLIQEKQLKISVSHDIIVEWIPYNRFNNIKELGKDEFATIYSAIWKDGLLKYDRNKHEYSRNQNIKVYLKLYNSQNITEEFLNESQIYL